MANKKQLTQKTQSTVIVENQHEILNDSFTKLCETLKELRNDKGILGYTIRNGISASIDLQNPEKLVEYAIFTSQVMESSKELADLFNLGDPKTILIEGNNLKILNILVNEHKINIFMNKKFNHKEIVEKISL